jgi:hypothetical protein
MRWIVVLFLLFMNTLVQTQEGEYEADLEIQLFQSVNQERQRRGVPPLKWNDQLREAARRHTDRIAEAEMLTHQFKDEPPLTQRIASTGLSFYASAENVALATDWPDVHRGLMQSEGHRRNILNPHYTEIGIGVRKRGRTFYATQNFARTTMLLKPSDAEGKIAHLFERNRRKYGRIKVVASPNLREAACSMAKKDDLSARDVPTSHGDRGVIAFTSNDLDELPPAMEKLADRGDVRQLSIGACFQATATYPGGTYWFAVVY